MAETSAKQAGEPEPSKQNPTEERKRAKAKRERVDAVRSSFAVLWAVQDYLRRRGKDIHRQPIACIPLAMIAAIAAPLLAGKPPSRSTILRARKWLEAEGYISTFMVFWNFKRKGSRKNHRRCHVAFRLLCPVDFPAIKKMTRKRYSYPKKRKPNKIKSKNYYPEKHSDNPQNHPTPETPGHEPMYNAISAAFQQITGRELEQNEIPDAMRVSKLAKDKETAEFLMRYIEIAATQPIRKFTYFSIGIEKYAEQVESVRSDLPALLGNLKEFRRDAPGFLNELRKEMAIASKREDWFFCPKDMVQALNLEKSSVKMEVLRHGINLAIRSRKCNVAALTLGYVLKFDRLGKVSKESSSSFPQEDEITCSRQVSRVALLASILEQIGGAQESQVIQSSFTSAARMVNELPLTMPTVMEQDLRKIENQLFEKLSENLSEETMRSLNKRATMELRIFLHKVSPGALRRMYDHTVSRLIGERFSIPRMSLFVLNQRQQVTMRRPRDTSMGEKRHPKMSERETSNILFNLAAIFEREAEIRKVSIVRKIKVQEDPKEYFDKHAHLDAKRHYQKLLLFDVKKAQEYVKMFQGVHQGKRQNKSPG